MGQRASPFTTLEVIIDSKSPTPLVRGRVNFLPCTILTVLIFFYYLYNKYNFYLSFVTYKLIMINFQKSL